MKKIKHYLTLTSAALLMIACSNETMLTEESPENIPSMENPITFAVEMENGTRAAGEIGSLSGAIGVFASYTGDVRYNLSTVSPNYMYNQQVTRSANEWTYAPVKYWPNTSETGGYKDYVSFFSYYPYISLTDAEGAADGIIGFSNEDTSGDPWLVYQLPASAPTTQTDLLYGVKSDGSPMLDMQKQSVSSKVTFSFRHALACVGDKITICLSSELYSALAQATKSLYVNKVTINYKNLTNKARLILNSNESPNWQPVISGDYISNRKVEITSDTDGYVAAGTSHKALSTNPGEISSGNGLFYIPIHLGAVRQEAEITVEYTVKGETTTTGSVSNSYILKEDAQKKESINIVLGEKLLNP